MSMFASILKKLNLEQGAQAVAKPAATLPKPPPHTAPAIPTSKPPLAAPKPTNVAPSSSTPMPSMMGAKSLSAQQPTPPQPAAAARPAAVPVVDVVAKLEAMAAKRPEKLNWKISIADLLFLLEIDNSFKARKELAEELGCPADQMGDSAKMNTWLHKTVLSKIAENGGNIPKELLD